MKKNAKQFGVVLLVVAAVLLLLTVFRYAGADSSLSREMKEIWGVELPEGGSIDLTYGISIENTQAGIIDYHLDIRAK